MENSNENSNSDTASRADLPDLPTVDEVSMRLAMVFPAGTPNRNYVVRELAAKTVFVMLYVGAIEGRKAFVRPKQIVSMTDKIRIQSTGGKHHDSNGFDYRFPRQREDDAAQALGAAGG